MALETATYISGLNSSNPTSSDVQSQGDDHLRLIKSTILATFPNITGAVTPTHTNLNNGLYSAQWSMNSDRLVNGGNTQPAFNAYRSTDQTTDNALVFDTVRFNQGSHYNNSTGKFTAPLAGLYYFAWGITMYTSLGNSTYDWILRANTATNLAIHEFTLTNLSKTCGHGSAVVRLAASDYVWMIGESSLSANLSVLGGVNYLPYFCGYLIA
jgi:hypothetical protein